MSPNSDYDPTGQSPQDFLSLIDHEVARFPVQSRRHWVQKALAATTNRDTLLARHRFMMSWLATLDLQRPEPLDRHLKPINVTVNDLIILEDFRKQLSNVYSCSRESAKIFSLLRRFSSRDEWQEAFSDAVTEVPRIITIAADKESPVNDWLRRFFKSSIPPSIETIVPPLTLDDLRQVRRAIDRYRKRAQRTKRRYVGTSHALSSLTVVHESLDQLVTDEELTLAIRAFADLASIDQQIWGLHISGHSMREIGKLLNRAPSTVCQRMVNAVSRVARTVKEQTR